MTEHGSPKLVVIVPSRERPDAIRQLELEFAATCTERTTMLPVVDDNDPTRDAYPDYTWQAPSRNMVQALNWASAKLLRERAPIAVGFMGDDHRPITRGWDSFYLEALEKLGTGIVYGNDLLQGRKLPTQCAMTVDIVQTIGYMAPPAFGHLFVDNAWRAWGELAKCISYLPEVIIEHRHPLAGRSDWDDGYRRVNSDSQYRADRQRWSEYRRFGLAEDVARISKLRD